MQDRADGVHSSVDLREKARGNFFKRRNPQQLHGVQFTVAIKRGDLQKACRMNGKQNLSLQNCRVCSEKTETARNIL
jgi:hypothetical protein